MNRGSERIFDEYLVTCAMTGDRQALGRLIARWQPKLLGHAWRLTGQAERAKDVVQDAWIEILRGLARLNDTAAFPAWAYRIVTRRCYKSFRRPAQEVPLEGEEAIEPAGDFPADTAGELAADVAVVLDAIGQLPAEQRAALALFYLDELSVAEIAIATDVPPGTVKTRLMHARRKVRALIEGDHP